MCRCSSTSLPGIQTQRLCSPELVSDTVSPGLRGPASCLLAAADSDDYCAGEHKLVIKSLASLGAHAFKTAPRAQVIGSTFQSAWATPRHSIFFYGIIPREPPSNSEYISVTVNVGARYTALKTLTAGL